MINNFLFEKLSQDVTDTTASAVLSDINHFMRQNFTANQLPDYTYTSLKTLLGEQGNNGTVNGMPAWAVKRIKSLKAAAKFKQVTNPEDLPLIVIQCSNMRPHPHRNNKGDYEAQVDVLVETNPEIAPSSLAFSLIKRIHQNFFVGQDQPLDLAEGVTTIKGIANLKLRQVRWPVNEWDVQKLTYIADAKIIE
jgi:hypothetical protein